jgi:phosphatidylglycerophosphate synthase
MRKINEDVENPFDNVLLHLSEFVAPFFKKAGFTPNLITTWSAIMGGISIYGLYIKNFRLFWVNWIIAYFFDNLDGYFARKYNMVTKFGDLYDHRKDTLLWIFTGITLFLKYKISISTFSIFAFVSYFCMKHIGCQQLIYNKKGESINFYSKMCKSAEDIKFTRYFGGGSLYLCLIWLVKVST